MLKHRFKIGTQYLSADKHPRLCTVIEQLTVTNSKGEVVKVYYHATHDFIGQVVTDYGVNDTNIARGIARLKDNA